MNILVTGGSGFIGSHVSDKLREAGHKVRIFDMVLPQWNRKLAINNVEQWGIVAQMPAEFYHGSVLDPEALRMAMSGIDVVYHLAAVADVKAVHEEPEYSEAINVRGTLNVLEAARKTGVKHVIYSSTIWVYGECKEQEVDEDTPILSPSHLYAATKMASEYYCRCYRQLYGLRTTILRYGIPYGPRARDGAVVPVFVRKALAGEPLTVAGTGEQWRQFIYVEDLAAGNVAALDAQPAHGYYVAGLTEYDTFNLVGNEKITVLQIAELVQELIGGTQIERIAERIADFSGKWVSHRRASACLNWRPTVSFMDGVERYITWYKNHISQS